jgi:predicted metal-binding membrane protein
LCRQVELVAIAVAVAWVASVWLWLDGGGGQTEASTSAWWCMPGMSLGGSAAASPGTIDPGAQMPMWLLMSLVMALPGELPAAQYVATNTFRRGRSSAVAIFIAVYLLVWLACGLPATVVMSALHGLPADALFATALAAAAGYELTPLKRRALNRCHRGAPLPPIGARRVAGVARFGWLNASGCVASCWPAMLVASIAPIDQPLAIAGFTVVMTYERLTRRPRKARRRVATSYLAIAAAFAVIAL